MTNLLRKLFIKDYLNVEDNKVREKHGILASFVGIFTNLLLTVFKILIGIITLSISIIADALNNMTDMASCIVNLFGFKLANKPADKEHPFGHERIEYIAGLIISFIIIALAVVLGYTSVLKIINQETQTAIQIGTFIVLGGSILVKVWQSFFYRKIGKIINSVSLKASAQDSLNDVISTTVVLIVSIISFATNGQVDLDAYAGIAVALFIVYSGIKLVIETANPLIGISPDNELVKNVVKDIETYDGVLGIHDLMCHSYGPTKIFITVHVEVDASVDVLKSHDLIDVIEYEVGQKHHLMLTIHMDPIDTKSEETNELKAKAIQFINEYDERLSLHDFRIVKGDTHTNVLFDVVLPFDVKYKEEDVTKYLWGRFAEISNKYFLVIKYDRDYVGRA